MLSLMCVTYEPHGIPSQDQHRVMLKSTHMYLIIATKLDCCEVSNAYVVTDIVHSLSHRYSIGNIGIC